MLQQNASLQSIQQDEIYLAKNYSSQLVDLYSEKIVNYVEQNVGRSHYQSACRYLRRMKKLGGNEEVLELIKLFRNKYRMRSALMDELKRV